MENRNNQVKMWTRKATVVARFKVISLK